MQSAKVLDSTMSLAATAETLLVLMALPLLKPPLPTKRSETACMTTATLWSDTTNNNDKCNNTCCNSNNKYINAEVLLSLSVLLT